MTTEEIKDYIVYEMEPDELCAVLGPIGCYYVEKCILRDRYCLGYEEEP